MSIKKEEKKYDQAIQILQVEIDRLQMQLVTAKDTQNSRYQFREELAKELREAREILAQYKK